MTDEELPPVSSPPDTQVFSTDIPPPVHRVLDEEGAKRRHIVVALCGSHAYGFASPDSDYDLKAVHLAPTEAYLGLQPPQPTFERMGWVDRVEIDYTSNELLPVLQGVLKGNGNFIERFLGRTLLRTSPQLAELQDLVQQSLSKRVFLHYKGFATSQKRLIEKEDGKTAKKVLYVLRTALTGTHLLKAAELVTDLRVLIEDYKMPEARTLIARKQLGERAKLTDDEIATWSQKIDSALALLEDAVEHSVLPDDPPNEPEMQAALIRIRKSLL